MSTHESRTRVAAKAGVLWRTASTRLPTEWGTFEAMGFERDVSTGGQSVETALALVLGDLRQGCPLLRVHSQCVTGEVFGSLRCDCGGQLNLAMQAIAQEGRGLVIYEYQEGRGIGLMAKLQTYELQDAGIDTVEANHALGFKADLRDFSLAVAILHDLRISRVRLLTNNPRKVRFARRRRHRSRRTASLRGRPDGAFARLPPDQKTENGTCVAPRSPRSRLGAAGHRGATLTRKDKTMTVLQATRTKATSGATRTGRLFLLELSGDRIHSMNPDGSDRKTIVTNCHLPDGIVVDAEAGHIYWTNMGVPNLDDGSIERADLDGKNRRVIVPQGITHTPKQIHLDKDSGKLYWCDREGMRVMRANLDGSQVETLVETGRGDKDQRDADPVVRRNHHRSEARENLLDAKRSGQRRTWAASCRANIDIPKGESPANRSDIEVLFDQLPEPIDLELDLANRVLYWTDRGDPPRGNTVNRAPIDKKAVPEILITHLMEGIGIALDVPGNRMFVTDFAGSVYSADLDGKNERNFLYAQGNLTGIAYAEI